MNHNVMMGTTRPSSKATGGNHINFLTSIFFYGTAVGEGMGVQELARAHKHTGRRTVTRVRAQSRQQTSKQTQRQSNTHQSLFSAVYFHSISISPFYFLSLAFTYKHADTQVG